MRSGVYRCEVHKRFMEELSSSRIPEDDLEEEIHRIRNPPAAAAAPATPAQSATTTVQPPRPEDFPRLPGSRSNLSGSRSEAPPTPPTPKAAAAQRQQSPSPAPTVASAPVTEAALPPSQPVVTAKPAAARPPTFTIRLENTPEVKCFFGKPSIEGSVLSVVIGKYGEVLGTSESKRCTVWGGTLTPPHGFPIEVAVKTWEYPPGAPDLIARIKNEITNELDILMTVRSEFIVQCFAGLPLVTDDVRSVDYALLVMAVRSCDLLQSDYNRDARRTSASCSPRVSPLRCIKGR